MSIYKDCDIRGIYGEEFDAEEMRLVGRAIGRRLAGRSIVVAGDVRVSTGIIKERLLAGLKEEGAHIIDIGIAPTPVAYFAKSSACFDAYALAIVTASHNPAKYNGIKLMFGEFPPTPGEIKDIEKEVKGVNSTDFSQPAFTYEKADIEDKYIDFISRLVKGGNGLKVVLDIGNGTTAVIAPKLYRALGYDVVELFGEADGRFPNRNPNPADFKNLAALRAKVVETGADFGVAFDGDGDRAVFVDDLGRPVINEKSLIMLTKHALLREENLGCHTLSFSVVYDQKCSRILPDAISEMGGTAILERSGHAFIKKTFLRHGSITAGEISGHFFFKELGHDDGIYAGLCMGNHLAHRREIEKTARGMAEALSECEGATPADIPDHKGATPEDITYYKGATPEDIPDYKEATLADLVDEMPDPFISPDLRYHVPYAKMDEVLGKIKEHYEGLGARISTYDGVRAELQDEWLLVRKSVTEEAMTVKIEAGSDERIAEIVRELEEKYFCNL